MRFCMDGREGAAYDARPMRILGVNWLDRYLDETLQPGHVRIQVLKWRILAPVPDLYFVGSEIRAWYWIICARLVC